MTAPAAATSVAATSPTIHLTDEQCRRVAALLASVSNAPKENRR